MRFWDSSAVVPLLLDETVTSSVLTLYRRDTAVLAWWGTRIECVSAVCRLERQGKLSEDAAMTALADLDLLVKRQALGGREARGLYHDPGPLIKACGLTGAPEPTLFFSLTPLAA